MSDVIEALGRVMESVRAVGKDGHNKHANYNFRGIDAVVNAVGPALRAHGVVVVPHLDSCSYADVQTSTGKPANACRVTVTYTFYKGEDSLACSVAAEAWDNGDKAAPKAMSVAFRTALLQALALPTDEPDPDSHTYERAPLGAVDLKALDAVIEEAKAAGVEGDFDATREWAATGERNVPVAIHKLRVAIDKKLEAQRIRKAQEADA